MKTLTDIKYMFDTTNTYRALQRALDEGWTIGKTSDPVSTAAMALTHEEAMEVAAQDPALLYFTH